jgi:hypothetical protein
MKWPTIDQLTDLAPLPPGYGYAFPARAEIVQIIRALEQWYPGIAVGTASCHMRESFYTAASTWAATRSVTSSSHC